MSRVGSVRNPFDEYQEYHIEEQESQENNLRNKFAKHVQLPFEIPDG